jgi:hypothetical protein
MSVKAMNWACEVIEQSDTMTSKAAQILLCLAVFHNQETGRCNPPLSRLVKRSKLSKDSVIRAIKELETDRHITTEKTKMRTAGKVKNLPNKYRLNWAQGSRCVRLGVVAVCDPKGNKKALRGAPSAFDDLAMLLDDADTVDLDPTHSSKNSTAGYGQ